MLSILIWLPLLGGLAIAFTPKAFEKSIRLFAILVSLVALGLSLAVALKFQASDYHFQMMESVNWIPSLGIRYSLGVDGISLWLVVITTLLATVGLCFSNIASDRAKLFFGLALLLETSVLGTLLSLDMVLFYSFFELSLFPIVFMIWIWGGENRKKAATRVFVTLFGGSIFMLVGMVALARLHQQVTGTMSFSIVDIQTLAANGKLWSGAKSEELLIFWAFALAFVVKAPLFPFHSWLVDTYTEGPIAVILVGAVIKTGIYGFARFCLPLFPDVLSNALPVILALSVIGIVYGAALAAVQKDVKRIVAFSSVSHVGFIMLGLASQSSMGVVGGILGAVYHGVASGLLILLAYMLCARRKTSDIRQFGGLKAQMPIFATLFLIATLAAVGLPGTNGFVSEFLSLYGAFQSGFLGVGGVSLAFAIIAATGVVLAAIYMLLMYQKLFYGPVLHPLNRRLRDIKPWEAGIASVLVALIFIGGLAPGIFTDSIEPSAQAARLMSQWTPGDRPAWSNPSTEVLTNIVYKAGLKVGTRQVYRSDADPASVSGGFIK